MMAMVTPSPVTPGLPALAGLENDRRLRVPNDYAEVLPRSASRRRRRGVSEPPCRELTLGAEVLRRTKRPGQVPATHTRERARAPSGTACSDVMLRSRTDPENHARLLPPFRKQYCSQSIRDVSRRNTGHVLVQRSSLHALLRRATPIVVNELAWRRSASVVENPKVSTREDARGRTAIGKASQGSAARRPGMASMILARLARR